MLANRWIKIFEIYFDWTYSVLASRLVCMLANRRIKIYFDWTYSVLASRLVCMLAD
uniref:Uncharacterized protein n=1 Tax=Lymantria dispar multicapsid nuclear polyhedrosis virus TaxID=10449 RepID=A0A7S8FA57_NPVLD|nr:hypothetical protein [Lymantria dispar multiple nucleopolyhedrovirus]QPD02016.1 hypothetical protein [Lymantria dispar multiple nucleopolyhedrovirus]